MGRSACRRLFAFQRHASAPVQTRLPAANGISGDKKMEQSNAGSIRKLQILPSSKGSRQDCRAAPGFQALAGLQQKYYLQDAATGEYAGLYLWQSPADFAAYKDSELRASIAAAYKVEGEPRVEVYRVMRTLRDNPA